MGPDGAWDMWLGPGMCGRGQDVCHCHCETALSWWSTRGGCVLAVSMDAGSTRDMPVCGVHDEGERQDTDKGGYAWLGSTQRAAGWTRWGYGRMRVACVEDSVNWYGSADQWYGDVQIRGWINLGSPGGPTLYNILRRDSDKEVPSTGLEYYHE